MALIGRKKLPIDVRIEALLKKIPDIKRIWVRDFLKTVYESRSSATKHYFLREIVRFCKSLEKYSAEKFLSGWNAVELTDIDRCQIESGVLKDSVRVFFRWLKNRKSISTNLADAIPTGNHRIRVSRVSVDTVKGLFHKWIKGDGTRNECIAGLLIIFFGLSNEELRHLKVSNFAEGRMHIGGHWQDLHPDLWQQIQQYLIWRDEYFFRMAGEYFFVTGISAQQQVMVDMGYFSDLFRRNSVGLTPSELRKAMIQFHRKYSNMGPELIGPLFRITARGAARHFT